MLRADRADGAAARPHHQGVGRGAVRAVVHALEQLAVGDAGGHEEAVLAGDQLLGGEDGVGIEVVACVQRPLPLVVVGGPEAGLDHAAHALHRAGRDDALRRASDAEQQVDAGVGTCGRDGARDVAVQDVLDAGAGLTDLLDQALVAGTVEQDHRDVVLVHALGLGHGGDVLGDRLADVDDVGGLGPGDQLLHVEHGRRVEHRVPRRDRHHRHGVVHPLGGQRGAVDRVDGHVALGTGAVADLLAVEQHRRVVLLALADDDRAAHADRADHEAHRVDGGLVGVVLVAPSDPACRGHRRRLGDAHQLEGEVAVGPVGVAHGADPRDAP